MSFNKNPKDPKKSIRLKYNRRREHLRHSLEQFLLFSEERLDEKKYGEIYKKADVELLYNGAKELLDKFPEKKEVEFTKEDFENFDAMLIEAEEFTKKIIEEMEKDTTDYFVLLKEMKEESENNEKNKKTTANIIEFKTRLSPKNQAAD